MSATNSERPQHYNPLLVTVLPAERRARHPYQLGVMMCLLTLGAWQLIIGPAFTSSVNLLNTDTFRLLNWVCIWGGTTGLLAAIVPERIVRWGWGRFGLEWDATYFRLWEEMGSHLLLATVWASYGMTVWASFGFAKGYSLGLAAPIWLGASAIGRAVQIWLTIWRAGTFRCMPSAIVGPDHPAAPHE